MTTKEMALRSLHLINREDRDRVRRFILLNEARLAREEEALALMSARLERGRLMEAADFPANVVTLHSQVRMRDADSGRTYVTTVSLPRDGGVGSGASLLRAYAKIVLLGACVGDDIVWRSAGGLRRARIEQILFQPESSPGHGAPRLHATRSVRTTRELQRTAS